MPLVLVKRAGISLLEPFHPSVCLSVRPLAAVCFFCNREIQITGSREIQIVENQKIQLWGSREIHILGSQEIQNFEVGNAGNLEPGNPELGN